MSFGTLILIIFGWILSIIISYGILIYAAIMMMYWFAQEGTFLSMTKSNKEKTLSTKITNFLLYVPLVNIVFSLFLFIIITLSKFELVNSFFVFGETENMTIAERTKFNENPTKMNLITIYAEHKNKEEPSEEETDKTEEDEE